MMMKMLTTELHNLCHPAIPDRRTWSKLGEHREHGEHGQDGKLQKDDIKHSLWFNALCLTQNTLFYIYVDGWTNCNISAWRTWSWVTSRLEKVEQLVEAWLMINMVTMTTVHMTWQWWHHIGDQRCDNHTYEEEKNHTSSSVWTIMFKAQPIL